jgi:hypothetical protein
MAAGAAWPAADVCVFVPLANLELAFGLIEFSPIQPCLLARLCPITMLLLQFR